MSTFFFCITFLLFIIIAIFSVVKEQWVLLAFISIAEIIVLFKIIIQIRIMVLLSKLSKNVQSENLPFYITKSWTRKRESSIWVGITSVTVMIYFLVLQILLVSFGVIASGIATLLILTLFIIAAFILMYINIQILDGYIKISLKRMDLDSVEWKQIKKEQNVFYKTIYIWIAHALFILPPLLFIIKPYRELWNKILKN